MRQPVQILFLILVTDLPPSIALGMEPGEKSILKNQPRPKKEPVVLGWMWMNMVMNGAIISVVVMAVYIVSLMYYCDGEVFQEDIDELSSYETKLMDARTVAFISLVFCENVRSYTSRSFTQPIWRNLCGNLNMHKAIILAQMALYAAVFIPVFSEKVLELRGTHIGIWGWLVALTGPAATLLLCELSKIVTGFQMQRHQCKLARAAADSRENSHRDSERKAPVNPVAKATSRLVSDTVADAVDLVKSVSGELGGCTRNESYTKFNETTV